MSESTDMNPTPLAATPDTLEPRRFSSARSDAPRAAAWLGLLTVYLVLFVATGYLAFLNEDGNPGYESYERLLTIEDQETKTFVVNALQQENEEHGKRQDLATQSFNVVLGALLGFLSASATAWSKREGMLRAQPGDSG